MKIFILFILLSTHLFASTIDKVFKPDSKLPTILQEKILTQILEGIPCLEKHSLKESKTEMRVDRIDQGVIDYYFTTTLHFTHYFDRYHPAYGSITVKSSELAYYCKDYCNYQIDEMPDLSRLCD